MNAYTSIIVLLALLVGCSSPAPAPQKEVQANLAKSVDCSTATADIKTNQRLLPQPGLSLPGKYWISPDSWISNIFFGRPKLAIL